MSNTETFIELIREWKHDEALEMLNAYPDLATTHTDREGQLHGASPLHWAAHRNAVELCKRLVELGADVNDSASDWWLTPLAWGADAGSVEAVKLLLLLGADVNQDAVVGTTALHAAAMGGSTRGSGAPKAYEKTAEILIANGADINRVSNGKTKQTPLDAANDNGNTFVASVLRIHGAMTSNSLD